MNLNPIGVLQITGYMIQVGIYEAFGDAEYPQAFYKVLFPPLCIKLLKELRSEYPIPD